MKAEIAVATVSGKAYYLIVNELRRKSMVFLSLTPYEPIPAEAKVVITTEKEKYLINHEKVLVYKDGVSLEALINLAQQIIQGKRRYETLVVGVDPGKVVGLAILADGKVIETCNCFSVEETSERIGAFLENLKDTPADSFVVKIGDGVSSCKERLLHVLDDMLPENIVLETVKEAGTNNHLNEVKHRRGLRDIGSAIKIAGRKGQSYHRRKANESYH